MIARLTAGIVGLILALTATYGTFVLLYLISPSIRKDVPGLTIEGILLAAIGGFILGWLMIPTKEDDRDAQ